MTAMATAYSIRPETTVAQAREIIIHISDRSRAVVNGERMAIYKEAFIKGVETVAKGSDIQTGVSGTFTNHHFIDAVVSLLHRLPFSPAERSQANEAMMKLYFDTGISALGGSGSGKLNQSANTLEMAIRGFRRKSVEDTKIANCEGVNRQNESTNKLVGSIFSRDLEGNEMLTARIQEPTPRDFRSAVDIIRFMNCGDHNDPHFTESFAKIMMSVPKEEIPKGWLMEHAPWLGKQATILASQTVPKNPLAATSMSRDSWS